MAQEKQALANVAKDEAQLTSDKAKADRGRQLSKEGIFSKEQTETLVSAADSSQANLDADRAAVESAQSGASALMKRNWPKQTCNWDTRRLLRQFPAERGPSRLSKETWSKTTTPRW